MASFVLFIFTIFLLSEARSAVPAKCVECFSDQGGSPCSDLTKLCPDNGSCLAFSSESSLSTGSSLPPSFSKRCTVPANLMIGSFHFNFGDRNILDFSSQVCYENGTCPISVQKDEMRIYKNGKSCPKCFRTGYDTCESDGEIFCVGDLVNCTEVNGEITSKISGTTIPFAGKGCVSQSVCNITGKSFYHGTFLFNFKQLQCSPANGALSSLRRLAFTLEKKDLGPQVAFFFPCIVGIFAVKMLS